MTALRITGLAVSRGQRQVLTDVSLDVDAGELVCLVGPNGAGKSTLVSAIAGTLGTSAGSVELMGEPISEMSALEQARRRAVLPQEHTIGFTFTCAEVVQMARHAWARTDQRRDDDAVVAAAMTACDVTGFARRSFESLSGGERGRVALARVLAQGTPILAEGRAALARHPAESGQGHIAAALSAMSGWLAEAAPEAPDDTSSASRKSSSARRSKPCPAASYRRSCASGSSNACIRHFCVAREPMT